MFMKEFILNMFEGYIMDHTCVMLQQVTNNYTMFTLSTTGNLLELREEYSADIHIINVFYTLSSISVFD